MKIVAKFHKDSISAIVEYMQEFERELVYYQFVKIDETLMTIKFFALNPESDQSLHTAIDLRFGI